MCAKLGYCCLDLLKNLCRVLFHLPGVGRRVLHVHHLDKDSNEGLELFAVDDLKGEKSKTLHEVTFSPQLEENCLLEKMGLRLNTTSPIDLEVLP